MSDPKRVQGLKDSISGNILAGVSTSIITILIRFFIPPFILLYLSLDEYGVWAACFILIAYIGILGSGPHNVVVQGVAKHSTHNEINRINQIVTTSIAMMLIIALITCSIFAYALPWIINLFHIPEPLRAEASTIMLLTVCLHMTGMVIHPLSGVLEGLQLIKIQRAIQLTALAVETAAIIILLYYGWGLAGLLLALAIRAFVEAIVSAIACFNKMPQLSLHPRNISKEAVKLLLSFGGLLQINSFLAICNKTMEKLLAGIFLGLRGTAIMELGVKLPVVSSNITSPINTVLLPAITHLQTQSDQERASKLYLRASRYLNLLTGFMMGFIGVFALSITRVWLGDRSGLEQVPLLMLIFTLPYQWHLLTGPCSALWRSTTRPYPEVGYSAGQFILYPCVLVIARMIWSVDIIMLGLVVAFAMLLSSILYILYTNYTLKIPKFTYLAQVILPGFAPYFIGFLLYQTSSHWLLEQDLSRIHQAWRLCTVGVIYCAITPSICYRLLFRWDERAYIKDQLRRSGRQLFQ